MAGVLSENLSLTLPTPMRPRLSYFVSPLHNGRLAWVMDVMSRGSQAPWIGLPHTNKAVEDDRNARKSVEHVSKTLFKNYVYLVNLHIDPSGKPLSGKPLVSYVRFPYIPLEVEISADSMFSPIPILGRNNPHYQFTGSEDSLELSIDWFSKAEDRSDVIQSCRWVATLSRSDGYKNSPPIVKLVWGDEDLLFRNHMWVVTKAPYSLEQFQPNKSLLPQQATQTLQLKRVTLNNLTHDELNAL